MEKDKMVSSIGAVWLVSLFGRMTRTSQAAGRHVPATPPGPPPSRYGLQRCFIAPTRPVRHAFWPLTNR